MRTGWEAMKLGLAFITLPCAFVNYPDLLIMGSGTIPAILLVTIAHLLISYGLYESLSGVAGAVGRVLFVAAGGTILFCPIRSVNSALVVIFGVALVFLIRRTGNLRKRLEKPNEEG